MATLPNLDDDDDFPHLDADDGFPNLADDDDFGGDYPVARDSGKLSGSKRPIRDICEEEEDVFGNKKGKVKVEESDPGADTGMILSLRENLQNCKDNLVTCKSELEATRSEIQKWHSAFMNGPVTSAGTSPEPGVVVTYHQNLKSSEESLKEQLEKAKKKEAALIVTFAKREQEIADLKSAVLDLRTQLRPSSVQTRRLLLDPAIHEEFTRLKNLLEEKDKKMIELQANVDAVNFSVASKKGKDLMEKCKKLQTDNEEIGARASEGKIHALTMKIAALKSQNAELRNQFGELYRNMEALGSDVERSNEMVYILQGKVEAKDLELRKLKERLSQIEEKEESRRVKEPLSQIEEKEESRRVKEPLSQIEENEEGKEVHDDDMKVADEANKPVVNETIAAEADEANEAEADEAIAETDADEANAAETDADEANGAEAEA